MLDGHLQVDIRVYSFEIDGFNSYRALIAVTPPPLIPVMHALQWRFILSSEIEGVLTIPFWISSLLVQQY